MPREAMKPPHGYDAGGKPIFMFNAQGVPVCGAKKGKGKEGHCMSRFRYANGRCKMHGGAIPVGPSHGNFKHGKFSKIIPDTMKSNFRAFLENPDILNMRSDIALQDMRIANLLEGFNENDTNEENWKKLNEICEEVIPILRALDGQGEDGIDAFQASFALVDFVKKIISLVKAGTNTKKLYREIAEASLVRAKLTEAEGKRAERERDYMPYDEVMVLFTQVMLIVRKNVDDKRIRNAIAAECDMLSSIPRNRVALGGQGGAGSAALVPDSEMARILDDDIDGLMTLHQGGKSYDLESGDQVSG